MTRLMDALLEELVSEERFLFYRSVCDFGASEIAPHVLTWERERCLVPADTIRAMGELGLFGLTVEERFGGAGGALEDLVLMGLALGYHSQSVAITPGAAASLGTRPLQVYGTLAQKQAYLPDLAAGKTLFAFGLSEPNRGSDAANPEVVAEKTAKGFSLRGEKCWSTNLAFSSHVIVHALTNPDGKPGHRTSCFIVPKNHENVHCQEMLGKEVWQQSSTGSITFDNAYVPEEALLGELHHGFKVMVTTLNGGRLFIAALALSSLSFALDTCRKYARERVQFDGLPIGRFQRVQDVLIDMDIALEQGLLWLFHLVKKYNAGTLDPTEAAKIKIETSRRASALLVLAMDMCGGIACLDEFGLARHQRDLFVCRVGEGSNFVLASLVARSLLPELHSLIR